MEDGFVFGSRRNLKTKWASVARPHRRRHANPRPKVEVKWCCEATHVAFTPPVSVDAMGRKKVRAKDADLHKVRCYTGGQSGKTFMPKAVLRQKKGRNLYNRKEMDN